MQAIVSRELAGNEQRRAFEDDLARALAAAGVPVLLVPGLYHVPEDDALWADLAGQRGVLLSWLNPRPAEWILRRHNITRETVRPMGLGEFESPGECCAAVLRVIQPSGAAASVMDRAADPQPRWYPVIDAGRCVNCKQCMQFCLFGVYELNEDGVVFARHPDNCKDGCPACSRICPRGAIMFPLHEDPAIAGAPGMLMNPDPALKTIFYKRTGRACPLCGQKYDSKAKPQAGSRLCTECGMPMGELAGDARDGADDGDDLDSLIDDLERLR